MQKKVSEIEKRNTGKTMFVANLQKQIFKKRLMKRILNRGGFKKIFTN